MDEEWEPRAARVASPSPDTHPEVRCQRGERLPVALGKRSEVRVACGQLFCGGHLGKAAPGEKELLAQCAKAARYAQ